MVSLNVLPTSLQAPHVVAVEPINGTTEILPTSPITITFSTAMDRMAAQTAVSLVPDVPGIFSWRDNQTLVWESEALLPISTTLALEIAPGARSWLGRPLQNRIHSQFTTLTRPYIVSGSPALDAKFVYAPDRVSIVFSRAMEPGMLGDSLQVDPKPQNFSLDTRGDRLTIYGFFEPGVHYQITIPAVAVDAAYGIPLDRDYSWSFSATKQVPHFSILSRDRILKVPANSPLEIPTQFANVSQLDVTIYALTQQEFETNASAPFETWYEFLPSALPLRQVRIVTGAKLDEYLQVKIPLDPLPGGAYYLKISTPEGPGDAVLLSAE